MKCPGSGDWVETVTSTLDTLVQCPVCHWAMAPEKIMTADWQRNQQGLLPSHASPKDGGEPTFTLHDETARWSSRSVIEKEYHDSVVRELRATIDGLEHENHNLRRDVYSLTRRDESKTFTPAEIAEIKSLISKRGGKP